MEPHALTPRRGTPRDLESPERPVCRDLAARIVRYRGWVVVAWLLAAVALVPAAGRAERTLEVAARIEGSESAEVERILETRFASPFAYYAILVLDGVPSPHRPQGRAALEQALAAVHDVPGVSGSFSYLDVADPLLAGHAGLGTYAFVGLDPASGTPDVLVPRLRAATAGLLPALRASYPDAALLWTGEAALNFDLRQTSAAQAHAAEVRILPITLLLLLIAFGALAAAALPLIAGFVSLPIALGAAVLLAQRWPLSILLLNVVSMIGLGLGIDYALLMVSRFREALRSGCSAADAAADAVRHAGHTIVLSGSAVAIGFAALLLVPLNEIRSVAVGGLLVVLTVTLLATTLLPALLVALGARVDAGRFAQRPVRSGLSDGDGWRRWAARVSRRPRLVLLLAGVPVLLLSLPALRLATELPRGDWLPPEMESARGVSSLESIGRGGAVQTIRVVLELPAGVTALDPAGWAATRRLVAAFSEDERVARVQALPVLLRGANPAPQLLSLLPAGVLRSFVSVDRGAALLELLPHEGADPNALNRLVRELRARDAEHLSGLAGARLRVGGLPALNADYQDTVAGRFRLVVALVLGGTLLALGIGFRSVLVPLKAVALNLISVAAAFGALVLVFQEGYGATFLGLHGATGGVFPAVPILVFCTVFGLSMDYEVFLVARIAEARAAGHDESSALAEGLARTGRVITSAAAIMIAVFGAFMLGDFVLIKMLGFALAVAILVDATVVRLAIGPALLRLAGAWNWWPAGLPGASRQRAELRGRSQDVAAGPTGSLGSIGISSTSR